MSRTPKSYYEPWVATQSASWKLAFGDHAPQPLDATEAEQRQIESDWRAARSNAEKSADWILWGSAMKHPEIVTSLLGVNTVDDGSRIIAIHKSRSWPEDGPNHEQVAKRIATCVTALAGVRDPVVFMADLRALLMAYMKGECEDPRQDPRVTGLLARCIPPEQMKELESDYASSA